jgi:phosphonate transport system ATP-binding protein
VLEISGLSVRYGSEHRVLENLSLSVRAGERVAVIGPSGTGKTTLFRVINGFVRPAAGTVRVAGEEVTRLRGRALRRLRSRVAVVSQRHDLVDELDVLRNVMAGALGRWSTLRALRFLLRPAAAEVEEARAALARVGLEHKLHARTAGLSGGEHQRVAIARALVQRPVLLLADEPVASLDPERSEQILELLTGLAEESHVTLLCSLHQPELAQRYFKRIVELRGGRVALDSSGHGSDQAFLQEGI